MSFTGFVALTPPPSGGVVIPPALAEAVKRGEAILFLGAGASFGAEHPDGRQMPLGGALKDLICDRFLSGLCKDRALDEVASLAENSAGRGEVDQFIATSVRGFSPPAQHRLVPAFRWKAVFGTNYDLLLEEAYALCDKPLQTLKPFYRDGGIERELATAVDPVPYYKLHGTIDHLHDRDAPLILTQESYLNPKFNRRRLFARLEDLGSEFPIVFVGTRLADHHIREILAAVDAQAGSRPTYFFVDPSITTYDEQLLASRRMTPVCATFGDFMEALNRSVAPEARPLYGVLEAATHSIERHFRRRVRVPESLRAFLTNNIEHVHTGLPSTPVSADLFFKGESTSWDPIERGYDIERHIYTTVMLRLLEDQQNAVSVFAIRGVAGAGKSVFGRRLAYDLATRHDRLVLFGRAGTHLRADPLLDLHNLTGLPVVLFVDQAADQLRSLEELTHRLQAASVPITLVLLDTIAAFGSGLEPFARQMQAEFELRSLTKGEIEALLSKLELNGALGLLGPMSQDERVSTFESLADRQLLVALYEATHGKQLEELLVEEYHRILLSEAQELYLLVCTLNRFSIPIRAGLVNRVMGVGFTDFEKRFLRPLEGLVFAEMDPRSRDFAYRARHPQIAEIVFRRILNTQTKQSEQYVRIIEGMNPSYGSDNAAMRKMLSARNLRDLSPDAAERRLILRVAHRVTNGDPFILQQQAILEMNSSGGDLEAAAALLEQAIEAQPKDPSLKHTKASLLARRAKLIKDPLARRTMRNGARAVLAELRQRQGSDPYGLALKATLAIDDLEDQLSALPPDAHAPAEPAIIRLMEDAERSLAQGLAGHPDFEALTREAYRLRKVMGQGDRGVALLRRTLQQQPHLEFVATTYAKAIADRDLPEALWALRTCLAEKPNSRMLNQAFFELMMLEADDFRDALLPHLRRAYTVGDGNIAMHVHAIRYFFMRADRSEYDSAITAASGMRVAWGELSKPRFPVTGTPSGDPYSGRILRLGATYGSVEVPGLLDRVHVRADLTQEDVWDRLREQASIKLTIWFNARGAVGKIV
jgi:hypothetical protein